ncbi:PREDICTED: uncharacterized protein LOC106814819 [Priapulus caudatus]|uniref:Uncharacterized protein LOC106814819 n=1 Tax=Priapulus caudatus TaxID=37621 RepID=A0ABM1ER42_PRICU|nr:PREDICTED: uncharacterized protein LOC106814819 [Priapulus caudatus]
MTTPCSFCNALLFPNENHNCCHKGKVQLPPSPPYPTELKDLFTTSTPQARNFRANIRNYNSSMAFASFGANIVTPPGRGPYAFRLHGQVYHRSGSLHPPQGTTPSFSQLYILDAGQALQARMQQPANQQCLPDVMSLLQRVLQETNPYAASYKHMQEVEAEQLRLADENGTPPPAVTMHILRGGDQRRYNDPRQDEIAVVFSSPDGAPPHNRDIVVHPKDQPPQRISHLSSNIDPMVYTIFYPFGELGWQYHMQHLPVYNMPQSTGQTFNSVRSTGICY